MNYLRQDINVFVFLKIVCVCVCVCLKQIDTQIKSQLHLLGRSTDKQFSAN